MSPSSSLVFRLQCPAQNYAWGKPARSSKVAEFVKASGGNVNDELPYAELWMGTHPNGPAKIDTPDSATPQLLSSVLTSNPNLLNPTVLNSYNGDLPFLFKILSIGKALSIQAHPDKKLAESLHAKFPNIYKDPNHKPEMAIALTDFEALCGFRPVGEIGSNIESFKELRAVVGQNIAEQFVKVGKSSSGESEVKKVLKDLFTALMSADEKLVAQQVTAMVNRLKSDKNSHNKGTLEELLIRLDSQFPGDVGVFCALLLNYMSLKKGEAIFLAANEPHAYLSGDIAECMATSDNVVRSGLTPKLKDVPTLTTMLTYTTSAPHHRITKPTPFGTTKSTHTILYNPPISEFSVLQTHLGGHHGDETASEEKIGPVGPSILITTEGEGNLSWSENGEVKNVELRKGLVYFIGNGVEVTIGKKKGVQELTVFRAFFDDKKIV